MQLHAQHRLLVLLVSLLILGGDVFSQAIDETLYENLVGCLQDKQAMLGTRPYMEYDLYYLIKTVPKEKLANCQREVDKIAERYSGILGEVWKTRGSGESLFYMTNEPHRAVPEVKTKMQLIARGVHGRFVEDSVAQELNGRVAVSKIDWFHSELEASIKNNFENGIDRDTDGVFPTAYAEAYTRYIRVTVGKKPLSWGFGKSGDFLITENDEPIPQLSVGNLMPFYLPWGLSSVGAFRVQAGLGVLGDVQPYPYPLIWMERLDWKPFHSLQFGMSRTMVFLGENVPDNRILDNVIEALIFYRIRLLGNTHPETFTMSPANNVLGFDADFVFWFLETKPRLYLELGFEDTGWKLLWSDTLWVRDTSYLVGFENRFNLKGFPLTSAVEFVRTGWVTNRHFVYAAGYVNKRSIIGHPIGPDSRGVYLMNNLDFGRGRQLNLDFEWTEHGVTGKSQMDYLLPEIQTSEHRFLFSPGFEKRFSKFTLSATAKMGLVHDFNFMNGNDRFLWAAVLKARFDL